MGIWDNHKVNFSFVLLFSILVFNFYVVQVCFYKRLEKLLLFQHLILLRQCRLSGQSINDLQKGYYYKCDLIVKGYIC